MTAMFASDTIHIRGKRAEQLEMIAGEIQRGKERKRLGEREFRLRSNFSRVVLR